MVKRKFGKTQLVSKYYESDSKLSVSACPPTSSSHSIRLSISASPATHWFPQNVHTVAHSAPIEVSHLQWIHTQALAKIITTHPQQPAHILQLYRSHTFNPSNSARVS